MTRPRPKRGIAETVRRVIEGRRQLRAEMAPKPGLQRRSEEALHYRNESSQKALRRQQNVDVDEPAVEGSEKPSVIRQRAEKKNAVFIRALQRIKESRSDSMSRAEMRASSSDPRLQWQLDEEERRANRRGKKGQ